MPLVMSIKGIRQVSPQPVDNFALAFPEGNNHRPFNRTEGRDGNLPADCEGDFANFQGLTVEPSVKHVRLRVVVSVRECLAALPLLERQVAGNSKPKIPAPLNHRWAVCWMGERNDLNGLLPLVTAQSQLKVVQKPQPLRFTVQTPDLPLAK
jgi:hypothetical protein